MFKIPGENEIPPLNSNKKKLSKEELQSHQNQIIIYITVRDSKYDAYHDKNIEQEIQLLSSVKSEFNAVIKFSQITDANCDLYINDRKYKFSTVLKFTNKGTYKIRLLLNEKLTTCKNMFFYCYNIDAVDLSQFDFSCIDDCTSMFENCFGLTSVDFSGGNLNQVLSFQRTFANCYSLEGVYFDGCKIENFKDISEMFYNCKKIKEINLSMFYSINCWNYSNCFCFLENLEVVDIRNFNTINAIVGGIDNEYIIYGVKKGVKVYVGKMFGLLTSIDSDVEAEICQIME